MKYTMTKPCDACPFLKAMKRGFTIRRLHQFSKGEFPCHKTADTDEETSDFIARADSQHCAGALIFLEKREKPHQMMRIAERLGLYDMRKLDADSFKEVR